MQQVCCCRSSGDHGSAAAQTAAHRYFGFYGQRQSLIGQSQPF